MLCLLWCPSPQPACCRNGRLPPRRSPDAGVRAKLDRIMASDYYIAQPEMRATVDVAAAVGSYGAGGVQAQESMVVSPEAPAVEESLPTEGHKDASVETVGQGALKLTRFLKELMQRRNIPFESLYTVRTIKEKLCYVAADYEAELRKDTRANCEVDGEGWFTLSEERLKTAEILFQPQIGGIHAMGLHRAVSLCMDHCYSSQVFSDDSWFKLVVLAGGSSCLLGLPERLEKEIHKLLPAYSSEGIRVLSPSFGTDSAWFGAKMISTVSTFTEAWCIKKKQFRQKICRNGPSFVSAW